MTLTTEEYSRGRMNHKTESDDASPTGPLPSEKVLSSAADDVSSSPREQRYSQFTKKQKRLVVFIITFAATFSPLSSFIFFPTINALAQSLHVSVEKINLTITSYMIISGIAPALIGDIADMTGRRIVYLMTFGIYLVANVGLAVQNSWTALFLLRMLQSAGGAAICSGVCLLLISVLLPETSRFIVGNGSREVSGVRRTLASYFESIRPRHIEEGASPDQPDERPKSKFRIPSPLASLKMLWAQDTALITTIYGVYYMVFSCLQASLSPLFINLYHLSETKAGLIYLPFGLGSVLGAYCSGIVFCFPFPYVTSQNQYPLYTTAPRTACSTVPKADLIRQDHES
ncbi:MAG: hypothetical protein Q9170_004157 [Blastenia crenularia]